MNEDELAAFLESGRPAPGSDGAEELRALLADESSWAEPSPGGADALLDAIRAASAADPEVMPGPGQRPSVAPSDGRRRAARPARGRRPAALIAAAAVIVLVVSIGGLVALRGGDDGDDWREFAVAGTELAPDASAVATVRDEGAGVAIVLDVRDLPPAAPGTYYQGWVKGDDAAVTVGTFHLRSGDDEVELWAGVDVADYPTLTVTLQEEGAGPESSGQVVLTGPVSP